MKPFHAKTLRRLCAIPFVLATTWTPGLLQSASAQDPTPSALVGETPENQATTPAPNSKAASKNGSESRPLPQLKVDNSPLPSNTPTYAPIVEKVAPSVVTINTSRKISRSDASENLWNHPLLDDPAFRRFFGLPENQDPHRSNPRQKRRDQDESGDSRDGSREGSKNGKRKEQSAPLGLGSGVIVSPDGYILTNNHVIDGADTIEVQLGNSPKKFIAKKVGGDPSTDIAVLKIEGKDFPTITFADSDHLRAGDIVIAVGNPFGLTRSATMGVVSAIGRKDRQMAQMADLSNFIQTDAAINMGNSGGALVDYQGRLVGINTAIFSRSGGNQGIGFSVPSNMARNVMESLIRSGRVVRGFLGIGLQEMNEALEKKLNVEPGVGILVSEISHGTPAEKAGLKEYDVIVGLNGKKVEGVQEFRLSIAGMQPGSKVALQVIRDRKQTEVNAVLGEKPDNGKAIAPAEEPDPDVMDGVTVADLDDNSRREFRIPEKVKGVIVTEVAPDSIAASVGIRPGEVIQEVERKPVTSADQAVKMSEDLKKEKSVLLKVYGRGSSRFVLLESKP